MSNKISTLIDYHLRDTAFSGRKWFISDSSLSGRGVFASCDIKAGEIIFQEKPLIIGPTGGRESKLDICTVCYKFLIGNDCVCSRGCSLPVCEICVDSEQHIKECNLYKSWEPIDANILNRHRIRVLTIVRGLFLNETEKELIYEMQANNDNYYKRELLNAYKCFRKPPADSEMLKYMNRIICTMNTNAFEALHQRGEEELSLRGLYPLSGILNHECTPNTCHIFKENNVMLVKATENIAKGTELTTTYTKILWSNMSRRLFLNMTKQFSCTCKRCLDPTENNSFISALFCRAENCDGWTIPENCMVILSPWRCMKCNTLYDSKHISKIQDFLLHMINVKTHKKSIKDTIDFINEKIPKMCPPSNQFVIELKLQVIWKMGKTKEDLTDTQRGTKIQYCKDILNILEKLNAGQCTMQALLEEELSKV